MSETSNISGTVIGKVYNENQRGFGGVKVRCGELETRTLFDGSYRFEDLSPGPHTLVVDVEGYGENIRQVQVKGGEITQLDFHLVPESGTARIWGYVLDQETKKPISGGGRLFMLRVADNKSVAINPETGYYEFSNLPPGTYKIWTSILNYRDEEKILEVEEAEEKRQDFLCERAKDIEPPWG